MCKQGFSFFVVRAIFLFKMQEEHSECKEHIQNIANIAGLFTIMHIFTKVQSVRWIIFKIFFFFGGGGGGGIVRAVVRFYKIRKILIHMFLPIL